MQNVGRKATSVSGFMDGGINFVFRYFTDDNTALNNAITADNYQTIGTEVGKKFKLFFSNEVPDYVYGDY